MLEEENRDKEEVKGAHVAICKKEDTFIMCVCRR